MRDSEIDALVAQAQSLAPRINVLLQNQDLDVALAALATLLAAYLKTLPEDEREAELQDWLRLVRRFVRPGERHDA